MSMRLWIISYTLDCPLYSERVQSGVFSTTMPVARVAQDYWDRHHAQWYTIKEFSARLAEQGELGDFKITGETKYKITGK